MTKIAHGTVEVDLDPKPMEFNEVNLSEYLMREAGHYNHRAQKMAELEYLLQVAEDELDAKEGEKFAAWKEEGGSDKLIEAKCKADPDLLVLRKHIAELKRDVQMVKLHLKSWDKCHENAQSLGHNLRKEMDKLGNDIMRSGNSDLEAQLEARMRGDK